MMTNITFIPQKKQRDYVDRILAGVAITTIVIAWIAGVAVLQMLGFQDVIVEAGGDLMISGRQPNGEDWRVAVAHPRPEQMESYIARFNLQSGAVATSGDYLNAFSDDKSLHHILDPRLGVSSQDLASVSVVAENAMTADALSTTIMVLGAEKGLALANRLPGVEALVVTKDLQINRTAGFPRSA